MSKLIDFYKDVSVTLGLSVTDNDELVFVNGETVIPWTNNKLPFVLPTKEHISTMYEEVNGDVKQKKLLFNPLDETGLKAEHVTTTKLRNITERQLERLIAVAGKMLLLASMDEDNQGKVNASNAAIITDFVKAGGGVANKAVNMARVNKWAKFYTESIQGIRILKVYTKANAKILDHKFKRVVSIMSPLHEGLHDHDATSHAGIKLSKKDKDIFKSLIDSLLPKGEGAMRAQVGSNDSTAPSFDAIMSAYLPIAKQCKSIIDNLQYVDTLLYNDNKMEIPMSTADLQRLDRFSGELMQLPSNTSTTNASVTMNSLVPTRTVPDQYAVAQAVNPPAQQVTQPHVPVYQQPAPVYHQPAPVYQQPAPAIPVAPPGYQYNPANGSFVPIQQAIPVLQHQQPVQQVNTAGMSDLDRVLSSNTPESQLMVYEPNHGVQQQPVAMAGTFQPPRRNEVPMAPGGSQNTAGLGNQFALPGRYGR